MYIKMAAAGNFGWILTISVYCGLFQLSYGDRLIDLTYSLDEMGVTYPINPKFNLTIMNRGPFKEYGIPWMENNQLKFAEHTGTHMDAPAHFGKGQWRVHQIPMERLRGPGVVINVKDKAANDQDYRVTPDDVKQWEAKHGKIKKGSILLMNSGWGKKYPDWNAVWGTNNLSDIHSYHFPSWHEDAVQWLVNERDISGIGCDTPSLDYGQSFNLPVHLICGKEQLIGIENVAYIDKLPEAGAMLFSSAMKVYEGSGAPIRLFAIVDDDTSDAAKILSLPVTFIVVLQLLAFWIMW